MSSSFDPKSMKRIAESVRYTESRPRGSKPPSSNTHRPPPPEIDSYPRMFEVNDVTEPPGAGQSAISTIEITDGFYDVPNSSPMNCGRIQVNGFMVDVLYSTQIITGDAWIYLESALVMNEASPPVATSATLTIKQQATELTYETGYARQLISRVTFADSKITSFSRENVSQLMVIFEPCVEV